MFPFSLFFKVIQRSLVWAREGGDIGLFITLVPKVFNNVFLFVRLGPLEFLLNLNLLVQDFKAIRLEFTRDLLHCKMAYYCKKKLNTIILPKKLCKQLQGERGQWAVYYTGLQSFIITFSLFA